jgi:fluoroquinolone resistance protein
MCNLLKPKFSALISTSATAPFFSASFKNGFLQYCNFSDLNMKRTSFSKCMIKECHFTNTSLQEADFTEADLTGTIFHSCDLSKADFSGASSYAIAPLTNKIKKAKFTLPDALALLSHFDVIMK